MTDLRQYIRDVPDFPESGILFRDIMPLLANHQAMDQAIQAMAMGVPPGGIDHVVAIESRGFLFGVGIAQRLERGLVLLRKPGKLPGNVRRHQYALEYGSDSLEVQADALRRGGRVLLVDDVLATGGTLAAAARLVRECGAEPVASTVLIELEALNGRERLDGISLHSVLRY
ncbi:MAG: adenine phosphoribosyltransferase [Xanthomonadales bacterium]|nr:adenine phosphoribosyltransferase [Xanthomonadales bacterium]